MCMKTCGVQCENSLCRYWIEHPQCQNCVLLSAREGNKTLQEIGDIFGITRMRICQIEKKAILKLQKRARGLNI